MLNLESGARPPPNRMLLTNSKSRQPARPIASRITSRHVIIARHGFPIGTRPKCHSEGFFFLFPAFLNERRAAPPAMILRLGRPSPGVRVSLARPRDIESLGNCTPMQRDAVKRFFFYPPPPKKEAQENCMHPFSRALVRIWVKSERDSIPVDFG